MKWTIYTVFSLALLFTACKGGEKANKGNSDNVSEEPKCMTLIKGSKPVFDNFELARHSIKDDCLELYITHSGGCKEHVFELQWNGAWMKSMPPQVNMVLSHNGNGDVCREYKQLTMKYDLKAIQMAGQNKTIINLTTGLRGKPIKIEYLYGE